MRSKQKKIYKAEKTSVEQKKQQPREVFSNFSIRPPVLQMLKIKVNDVCQKTQEKKEKYIGDPFKVNMINFNMQQFKINIKLFQQTLEQEKVIQTEPAQLVNNNLFKYSAQNCNSLKQQQKTNDTASDANNSHKKYQIKSFSKMPASKAKVEQVQKKERMEKQPIFIRIKNDDRNQWHEEKAEGKQKKQRIKQKKDSYMIDQKNSEENHKLLSFNKIIEIKQSSNDEKLKKKENCIMIDQNSSEENAKSHNSIQFKKVFEVKQQYKEKQHQSIYLFQNKNEIKQAKTFCPQANNKIDLCKHNLNELVSFLYKEKLMLPKYYQIFQQGYGTEYNEDAILEINEKCQQEKQFRNYLFAIIDHRMFAAILIRFNQDKYTSSQIPSCLSGKMSYQMRKNYGLTIEQYLQEWDYFNQKNLRFWMPNSREFLSDCEYFKYIPKIVQNNSSHPLNILLNL